MFDQLSCQLPKTHGVTIHIRFPVVDRAVCGTVNCFVTLRADALRTARTTGNTVRPFTKVTGRPVPLHGVLGLLRSRPFVPPPSVGLPVRAVDRCGLRGILPFRALSRPAPGGLRLDRPPRDGSALEMAKSRSVHSGLRRGPVTLRLGSVTHGTAP